MRDVSKTDWGALRPKTKTRTGDLSRAGQADHAGGGPYRIRRDAEGLSQQSPNK